MLPRALVWANQISSLSLAVLHHLHLSGSSSWKPTSVFSAHVILHGGVGVVLDIILANQSNHLWIICILHLVSSVSHLLITHIVHCFWGVRPIRISVRYGRITIRLFSTGIDIIVCIHSQICILMTRTTHFRPGILPLRVLIWEARA